MNEIKIYLKTSGRIAELYKDFDLYEGCYRNSQMSVYVPKSLLYENEDGTFANLVKTGAILTAPNGKKLTTKSYYLDYVKTETVVGIAYAVYTIITPKEFCVYAGTQTVVVNVESIDNTDKDNQKVISVTTTQTANLIVLESAYLGQDEPIEPTELDKIKATLTEIEGDITGLQSKVSDISDKVSTLSDVTTELMSDVDNLSIQVSDLSEDKLDKQSGATAYEEAYVKDTDGSQKMERVTITSIASAIVKRDANGNINIAKGLSGNPKNGANMENIADVEEKISKCPTLDGNNDFTGENTFEEAIQAKKGTVVKNSLDETNYNAGYISRNDWTYLFPADSGTFALTKNIPTDYATQTALANTQRQVDGLYTLLEQKNEIYVQTATDTYTTRETAGGENIADGVQTPVKKITGKTVKTTNLIPYPYYNPSPTVKNGITFTVNEDYSVTANGTATADANYILVINSNPILLDNSKAYTLSGCPSGGGDSTYRIYIQDTSFSETYIDRGDGMTFTPKNTEFYVYITISNGVTINNLVFKPMLNEGSTALSYMPYFPGLKNAFFKEIVSTGRNLFSAETAIPYNNCTYENGVVKQISADSADYYTWKIQFFKDSTFLTQSEVLFPQTGTIPALTIEKPSEANRLFLGLNGRERDTLMMIDVSNFPNGKYTATWNVLNITQGSVSWNNIMLNYGSSALPYEPYTQSVLSLPEAVELTEYDTAYPETGEIQRQSETMTFDGTEDWIISSNGEAMDNYFSVLIPKKGVNGTGVCNYYDYNDEMVNPSFWIWESGRSVNIKDNSYQTVEEWKAHLAALSEAGNPLTVTYKTAEVQSTEQADFSADSYIAWKNGSETIEQGNTDNSEYGAENTVEQDYYLLTAPEEVTKE